MDSTFGLVSISDAQGTPVAAISVDGKLATCSGIAGLEAYTTINAFLEDWDAAMVPLQTAANDIAAGKISTQDKADATLLRPHSPPQVFCTGANYHKHVVEIIIDRFADRFREEFKTDEAIHAHVDNMMTERAKSGTPYIFTRIASSYAGPFDDVVLPKHSSQPDWEAELALVFKKGGSDISRDDAMDHVAWLYGCQRHHQPRPDFHSRSQGSGRRLAARQTQPRFLSDGSDDRTCKIRGQPA